MAVTAREAHTGAGNPAAWAGLIPANRSPGGTSGFPAREAARPAESIIPAGPSRRGSRRALARHPSLPAPSVKTPPTT